MPSPGVEKFKIFSGTANPALARRIAEYLGMPLGAIEIRRFADGEIYVQVQENVRGADVFVIQPTCPPVNENLMELLLMIDAFKRASAWRITAVMPYYGYARQDRKDKPRVPISSKLVADMLQAAGAHRLLFMDLHADPIVGFFDVPVDHLYAAPVFLGYIRSHLDTGRLVMVSPDAGGVARTRALAKRAGCQIAIMDKRREQPNEAEVLRVVGDVRGMDVLIVDDIVDTGGTLLKAVQTLLENGARRALACCTHAILSGSAVERIEQSPLERLIVTDTVPLTPEKARCPKIEVLSVAWLFAEAIRNIHEETSVSVLFE
ncbi:MAG: ribose-phosphate pyrophosphokinase [Acidobacteria bacterium]|nr:ribose-phosphate pyrophosphokinase [Acidobacteriota bacterium]MDW7983630.1 ribose-phosphate pyrophosphokinase [Acidobacteriota bacterium]